MIIYIMSNKLYIIFKIYPGSDQNISEWWRLTTIEDIILLSEYRLRCKG
jgi:hypothetical protein